MNDFEKDIAKKAMEHIDQIVPEDLKEEMLEKIDMIKHHKERPPKLKLLVTILSPEDAEKTRVVYKEACVYMLFKIHGMGTANSEILDLLGLGSSQKTITVCIAPEEKLKELMRRITKERKLRARGFGIAFMVPLSSSAAAIIKMAELQDREQIKENIKKEVEKMKQEAEYELILSVINPGYSEDLMDAARSVGANGGTVIHARQVGKAMERVWGITIQGEREIIAIIAKHEDKVNIMKAIASGFGIKSEAQGITIAIPVDSVAGIEE